MQRFRLLCSQKYIHVTYKRELENRTRTARRDHRDARLRLSQNVQRLRVLGDSLKPLYREDPMDAVVSSDQSD